MSKDDTWPSFWSKIIIGLRELLFLWSLLDLNPKVQITSCWHGTILSSFSLHKKMENSCSFPPNLDIFLKWRIPPGLHQLQPTISWQFRYRSAFVPVEHSSERWYRGDTTDPPSWWGTTDSSGPSPVHPPPPRVQDGAKHQDNIPAEIPLNHHLNVDVCFIPLQISARVPQSVIYFLTFLCILHWVSTRPLKWRLLHWEAQKRTGASKWRPPDWSIIPSTSPHC